MALIARRYDAAGNLVPDGTRIALTGRPWYRRSDGGYPNGSVGGIFIEGTLTPNDGDFRTFTVTNGRVDATYSAETIPALSPNDPRSAVIAALVASSTNSNRVTVTPWSFGEGKHSFRRLVLEQDGTQDGPDTLEYGPMMDCA